MNTPDFKHIITGKWVISEVSGSIRTYTVGGRLWSNLRSRCKAGGKYQELRPTYIGTVNLFESSDAFIEWARQQRGYGKEWELDKDLVGCGKVYSEIDCVFLPREINIFLTGKKQNNSPLPQGVHWCNRDRVFVAQCRQGDGSSPNLGRYSTAEEAFTAYKTEKERLAKTMAEKWKGQVDDRAYIALLNYKVESND